MGGLSWYISEFLTIGQSLTHPVFGFSLDEHYPHELVDCSRLGPVRTSGSGLPLVFFNRVSWPFELREREVDK